MIVKKTCRKRLTAFMRTASRYNHASPDILKVFEAARGLDSSGARSDGYWGMLQSQEDWSR